MAARQWQTAAGSAVLELVPHKTLHASSIIIILVQWKLAANVGNNGPGRGQSKQHALHLPIIGGRILKNAHPALRDVLAVHPDNAARLHARQARRGENLHVPSQST